MSANFQARLKGNINNININSNSVPSSGLLDAIVELQQMLYLYNKSIVTPHWWGRFSCPCKWRAFNRRVFVRFYSHSLGGAEAALGGLGRSISRQAEHTHAIIYLPSPLMLRCVMLKGVAYWSMQAEEPAGARHRYRPGFSLCFRSLIHSRAVSGGL